MVTCPRNGGDNATVTQIPQVSYKYLLSLFTDSTHVYEVLPMPRFILRSEKGASSGLILPQPHSCPHWQPRGQSAEGLSDLPEDTQH